MSNAGPGPNSQTNLVISIVAPVIAVIAVLVLYFTKPVLVPEPAPAAVNTTAAKLPDPGVQLANALPGSGGTGGGGAAAGGGFGSPAAGGGRGGPMGFSTPGGAPGRAPGGGPPAPMGFSTPGGGGGGK